MKKKKTEVKKNLIPRTLLHNQVSMRHGGKYSNVLAPECQTGWRSHVKCTQCGGC